MTEVVRSLDIGCGQGELRGEPSWDRWGIDIRTYNDSRQVVAVDLVGVHPKLSPLPFEDDYFDIVFAYDILEHIPMRVFTMDSKNPTVDVMINLFNELHRVIRPGGLFESFTPHMPHYSEVFRDPTHCSVWTEQSWDYWTDAGGLMAHYGYTGNFSMLSKEWIGAHLKVLLKKNV